jgi:hypothetical protein
MVRPNRWEAMLPSWTHGTAITVATEVQRLTTLRPPRQQDAPTHHSIRPDQQIALSIAVSNRICRSSRFLPSFPSRGSCSLPSATAHDNKSAEWYFHCRWFRVASNYIGDYANMSTVTTGAHARSDSKANYNK